MTIRWGVLGAGGIADRRTIPEGITQATDSKLVAVMDVDEGRPGVGEKYGADWHVNAQDLLERSDVDAVYVATPVAYHAELVCEAARQGKHVLCEKPLALNVAEAEQAIKACDEHGVKLSVGYMMRFTVLIRNLRKCWTAVSSGSPYWPVLSSRAGIPDSGCLASKSGAGRRRRYGYGDALHRLVGDAVGAG